MRTIIISLDFHDYPTERHTAKNLVALIGDVVPDYSRGRFIVDFHGTSLYQSKYASEGKGFVKRDREQADYVLQLFDVLRPRNVVLLGRRVTRAFDQHIGELDFLKSKQIDARGYPIRFWSVPHPGTGRNRWFKNPLNKIAAAKLLASLADSVGKREPRNRNDVANPPLKYPAGCCQECGCVVQMTKPRCACEKGVIEQ